MSKLLRYKCSECPRQIGDKAYEYAKRKGKLPLCWDCFTKDRDSVESIRVNFGMNTIVDNK